MIRVHHLNNSRSQRILWMLEELELDYEIKHYQRNKETMLAPDELKAVHPLGKSPVITDGGLVVAESGAIIEYLGRKYGKDSLTPRTNSKAYQPYVYWLHFAEGSLMPPLLMNLVFEKVKTAPMPFFVRPIAKGIANKVMDGFVSPNIKRHFEFIEAHLAENDWFAGDKMTGADIQMSFPLEASASRGLLKKYPKIQAYVTRIQKRTAYRKALEKGGEYDYAV